jgi:hypothetical protein
MKLTLRQRLCLIGLSSIGYGLLTYALAGKNFLVSLGTALVLFALGGLLNK